MSSPFGPMVLICNRGAGRKGNARVLPEVLEELEKRGLEHEVRFTEGPGHASEIATKALEEGCRLVVAVGGDGTVHEVVNGMIRDDVAVNPEAALGVVASGSGCDFIKTFGLPTGPTFAAAHLDGPESFPIDIGKITLQSKGETVIRYFANIAEAGIGAAVVQRAMTLPRALGPTRYLVAFWLMLRKFKSPNVVVDLVDRKYEGRMNNLVVANGQFFGGGMKIAPKAAPTDGLLDVQVDNTRKKEAIALLPKIYKGQHVPHPDIREFKRARLSITSDREIPIEADGELLGYTPATFEVLRDAIRLKV
jgi:diacylglycerol kinase (ATP)